MARDCSALGGVDLIGGRVGNDDRVHADSLLPGAVDCSKHFEPTAAMVFCRTRKAEAR
jgi:hypothetical protein